MTMSIMTHRIILDRDGVLRSRSYTSYNVTKARDSLKGHLGLRRFNLETKETRCDQRQITRFSESHIGLKVYQKSKHKPSIFATKKKRDKRTEDTVQRRPKSHWTGGLPE